MATSTNLYLSILLGIIGTSVAVELLPYGAQSGDTLINNAVPGTMVALPIPTRILGDQMFSQCYVSKLS